MEHLFAVALGSVTAVVGWFVYAAISDIRAKRIEKAIERKKPAVKPVDVFEDKLEFGRKRRREEVGWFYEAWDRIERRYPDPAERPDDSYRREYAIARAEREWKTQEWELVRIGRTRLREIEKKKREAKEARMLQEIETRKSAR